MSGVSRNCVDTPLSEVIANLKTVGKALGMESASQKEVLNGALAYVQEAKENEKKDAEELEAMKLQMDAAYSRIEELERQLAAANPVPPKAEQFCVHLEPMNKQISSRESEMVKRLLKPKNDEVAVVSSNSYGAVFCTYVPKMKAKRRLFRTVEVKVEEEEEYKKRTLKILKELYEDAQGVFSRV